MKTLLAVLLLCAAQGARGQGKRPLIWPVYTVDSLHAPPSRGMQVYLGKSPPEMARQKIRDSIMKAWDTPGETFEDSLIHYVNTREYDGVEISWEVPVQYDWFQTRYIVSNCWSPFLAGWAAGILTFITAMLMAEFANKRRRTKCKR